MDKYIINIDKLVINLSVNNSSVLRQVLTGGKIITEKITLYGEYNPIASNNRNIVKIYLNGEKVGTVMHNAKAFKHNSRVQFYFSKPKLYSGKWYRAFSRLMKELNLEYDGLHSIEIAYDATGLLKQLREWYNHSTLVGQSRYRPFGRKTIVPYTKSNDGIDTFYMGGRMPKTDDEATSNPVVVEVKVYDKLKAARDKDELYFLDYYEQNGFNLDEGVDRCELYLRGRKLNRVITDLKMLTRQDVLVSILKDYARYYLQWRDLKNYHWNNGNKKHEVVELIDFDKLKASKIQFRQIPEVNKTKLKSNKTMIRTLYSDYICKGYELLRDTLVFYILQNKELKVWTLIRYKQFNVDFERACEDGVQERIDEMEKIFLCISNGLDPFEK
ncbi:hypothetical protein [Pontibacter harenae]|uniref:hypothetical protein n=1 Tax=Pontibacter harenae TaxID=2894083 RepID=UPI001E2A1835|nr:hypothetical protein [Pontibacter harenae]MCC9166876.1 hypothetical protein [Pontibacter harenae]